MGKAVQHPGPFAQFRRRPAVIFLIQEESGLLPFLHIHIIAHAVLHDLYFRVEWFADEALDALHSFLFAHLRVTPLIDAADMDAVGFHQFFQDINDHDLEPVDPQRQGLHHQHVGKFIDHQTRKEIRFAEDHPAAGNVIHNFLPVFPRILHAHPDKRLIDFCIPVSCHHADRQFRIPVDEPFSQRITVKIMDGYDIPVRKAPHDALYFIIINPGAALL